MIFNKNTKNLAFIFGCPRGGTTWLWSLLESHQDVIPFLLNFDKIKGNYTTSESGIYVHDKKNARKKIRKFAKQHKRKIVIEKTPLHTLQYKEILSDFPESTFITIFRNPLAIVSSMVNSKMKAFENYDIELSIDEVKKYYDKLIEINQLKNSMSLTYERLYIDTETELKQLLKFLNLNNSHIKNIIDENTNSSKVAVEGAFRKAKIDSYKTEFNDEQISYIETNLKNQINIFKTIDNEYPCSK